MVDVIQDEEYTELSVSTSRNIQEVCKIQQGDTKYGVLASVIDVNMSSIDEFAAILGRYVGQKQVEKLYDEQYFDPKFSKWKNFLSRNIILDPNKKIKMERERIITGYVSSCATEAGIKYGARFVQAWSNERNKYEIFRQIYTLLYSYSQYDTENSDMVKTNIELSKIRNSFPLTISDKKKIYQGIHGKARSVEEIALDSSFSIAANPSIRDSLLYMLFSIHCQKYGDKEEELSDNLLAYYDVLNYSGMQAKEMIREKREEYSKISKEQTDYLKLARGMVREMFVSVPEIDVAALKNHAINMAKYDPYSLRRKKVQNVVGSGAVSLAGVLSKRPDVVIHAGSTAISQLDLENGDNALEFLEKRFRDAGVDTATFQAMLGGSSDIEIGVIGSMEIEN